MGEKINIPALEADYKQVVAVLDEVQQAIEKAEALGIKIELKFDSRQHFENLVKKIF